jgi:hypothetical protein
MTLLIHSTLKLLGVQGVPNTEYPGFSLWQGTMASLFRSEIVFRIDTTISELQLMHCADTPAIQIATLLYSQNASSVPVAFNASVGVTHDQGMTTIIDTGGWFAAFSPSEASNSHIWYNRGAPLSLSAWGMDWMWVRINAELPKGGLAVKAGDRWTAELVQIGIATTQPINSNADVLSLIGYLENPTGLTIERGTRITNATGRGLLDMQVDERYAVGVQADAHPATDMMLPLRVGGLQSRWSVGVWQLEGYTAGLYSDGKHQYSALGLDDYDHAYVPMYVGKGPTHVVVGHPVIAIAAETVVDLGELFVQATYVNRSTHTWHVDVNNPTKKTVKFQLVVAMPEALGLVFPGGKNSVVVEVLPGEMVNVM